MARVVGITADELAAAGREDATRVLNAMDQDHSLRHRLSAVPGLGAIVTPPLTSTDGQELLPLIASSLEAIEQSGLPKAAQRELTSLFVDNLIHDAARRHNELALILRVATSATSAN